MADEIRLGILVAIVTIAIPTFVIASTAQAKASEISPAASLAQNLSEDGVLSSEQFQSSNPEEAMYMMYGAQAMEELDRCFEPKGPYAELCTGSVDLIVKSCNISSDVRLEVCDDPRIKGLLQGA